MELRILGIGVIITFMVSVLVVFMHVVQHFYGQACLGFLFPTCIFFITLFRCNIIFSCILLDGEKYSKVV